MSSLECEQRKQEGERERECHPHPHPHPNPQPGPHPHPHSHPHPQPDSLHFTKGANKRARCRMPAFMSCRKSGKRRCKAVSYTYSHTTHTLTNYTHTRIIHTHSHTTKKLGKRRWAKRAARPFCADSYSHTTHIHKQSREHTRTNKYTPS